MKTTSFVKKQLPNIVSFVILTTLMYLFFTHIMNFARTETESMAPTIQVGDKTSDIYLCYQLAYIHNVPKRGDIIIFQNDELGELMCKRVIGLPGETVSFQDGYVYIDGKKLDESQYIDNEVETNCLDQFVVPADHCFVLGDNRENSLDSRFLDQPYIPFSSIHSKVLIIFPTHTL